VFLCKKQGVEYPSVPAAPLDIRPVFHTTLQQHILYLQTEQAATITVQQDLDDWLSVHSSITLVDFQIDEQYSYLFTYNTFIKLLYMFRALSCSSLGDLCRNCTYAASGIVTVCR
jgi:hypothetical protein